MKVLISVDFFQLLAFLLLLIHKVKKEIASGVLFFFWLLSTACDISAFQRQLRMDVDMV